MFKKFFSMFVMAAMLTGCDKDPKPEEDTIATIQLVTKIAFDDGRYHTFEYDDKNRLTKSTRYTKDETIEIVMTVTYDNEGEVVSIKGDNILNPNENGAALYTRTGNRIDMCSDIDRDGKCDNSLDVEYIEVNAQNEMVKLVDEDSYHTETTTYMYTNGNITKATYEYKSEYESYGDNTVYTYDDKKSPWIDCAMPKWFIQDSFFECKNNVLTKTTTSNSGGKEEINYTYTYDDGGYVLTRAYVSQNADGSESNKTEIYTYVTLRKI